MPSKNNPVSTPRSVFMHLLLIVTLYISVVSFLAVIFQYINILFPDTLNFYPRGIYDTIRTASSALIVVFPVYLFISVLQQKEFVKNIKAREVGIRKWLIYLTLFIAALTIIIDLIQLINGFYSGELTIQFGLKITAVLCVAGAVFGYYMWDLRRKNTPSSYLKYFATASGILILSTVIAGFFIVGSPSYQRMVRFDDERVSHLQQIQNEVVNYFTQKQALPQNLSQLTNSITGFKAPIDPLSGEKYEYKINEKYSFTLCAHFQTKSIETDRPYRSPSAPKEMGFVGDSQNWIHKAGRVCFDRTIDPDFYRKPL